MPTVAELEATLAKERAEVDRARKLVDAVYRDPNLRGGVAKHIKALYPDQHLVGDDWDAATAPVRGEVEGLKKQLENMASLLKKRDEDEAAARKERENADYTARLAAAREQFNLTDEGFKAMVGRMTETKNYTDPFSAAAYIVSQTPPAAPTGPLYGAGNLNFAGASEPSDDAEYKLLHSGLDGPSKFLEANIRRAFDPRTAKDYVAKEMGKAYADMAFMQ